ncbi:MAG: RnfABCDGE type electron transport complex subunit G [Pseudomonadota bacterium]
MSTGRAPIVSLGIMFAGILLIVALHELTRVARADQLRLAAERPLRAMLPGYTLDPGPLEQVAVEQPKRSLLGGGEGARIRIGRVGGRAVAAILPVRAERGYGGAIDLLIAVDAEQAVLGVVPAAHRETPGLGDAIDPAVSSWSSQFTGKSLRHLEQSKWSLTLDGGAFDQISGATVTSRATVDAMARALTYLELHADRLFAPAVLTPLGEQSAAYQSDEPSTYPGAEPSNH